MTQHVRNTYREHRGRTWAIVLAVVALAAAVVIPFASGAAPKYYTLGASPTVVCYTGASQTQDFTFTLTNEARNNVLGSVNITPPSVVSVASSTLEGAPLGSVIEGGIIKLRNLSLVTSVTITVKSATITSPGSGPWTSIAKQSNDFADQPGPGNLFTLKGEAPSLTAAECSYAFTSGPRDTLRNAAQSVTVELRATVNGIQQPMPGSGRLDLEAYQGKNNATTPLASNVFEGLTTTATSGTWTFSSVVGTVSGGDYRLRVKNTSSFSSYFIIADCIPDQSNSCDIAFTPSDASASGGGSLNGTQIGSPIALSFSSVPSEGQKICSEGWGWSPLTFPQQPDGSTTFDGLTLTDYSYAKQTGYLKLTTYLRNDLYVQTNPSNTNDILICAGGKHSGTFPNETTQFGTTNAFMGRGGTLAQWDVNTGLYWGVLERVSNCNKSVYLNSDSIPDPVLCAWGTQDITINGVTVKYRTATVLVPADWDWKNFG